MPFDQLVEGFAFLYVSSLTTPKGISFVKPYDVKTDNIENLRTRENKTHGTGQRVAFVIHREAN